MKILRYLLKKEFLQIFRNKSLLPAIIMMPVVQLSILPWAATFEQKDITLTVIDNDKSACSRKLIDKTLSTGYFKLGTYPDNYNEAVRTIEQGKADMILEIPHNFEYNLTRNDNTNILLTVDAVDGQKAGLGSNYLNRIIRNYQNENAPRSRVISLNSQFRNNNKMDYGGFMPPGFLVILVTLIGGMLSAQNIVREKELGTIEQINVTPVPKHLFILAKLIPFWIIGLINITIGMIVIRLVFGSAPTGSIVSLYIFSLLYLIAFTGMGLMISNFAKNQQQAMFIAIFLLMVFVMLSGLYTSINNMPLWAQSLTQFNPLRHFVEVVRLVYIKGSGFCDILPHFLYIGGFLILFNISAVLTYRKTQN